MEKKRVLFVCVHNSGRSQMAEAFFNLLTGEKAAASSAGTQPAIEIDRTVVKVMNEVGIDISHRLPKLLTLEMVENVDRVITMGCGADPVCPARIVPMEDWQIEDLKGKPTNEVRKIRNIILGKVKTLIEELDPKIVVRMKGGEN
jgi:arsenate reductase